MARGGKEWIRLVDKPKPRVIVITGFGSVYHINPSSLKTLIKPN
jgi:hypothetical protein